MGVIETKRLLLCMTVVIIVFLSFNFFEVENAYLGIAVIVSVSTYCFSSLNNMYNLYKARVALEESIIEDEDDEEEIEEESNFPEEPKVAETPQNVETVPISSSSEDYTKDSSKDSSSDDDFFIDDYLETSDKSDYPTDEEIMSSL